MKHTTTRLRTYTGETFKILGKVSVTVSINNQDEQLSLLVVEGDGPSLLDKTIKLDWAHLHQVVSTTELQRILNDHTSLFSDELGYVKGTQAKIYIDSTATPKFCRARTVPYSLREKVEREIN